MARFIITDPQSVTQIFQISSSTVNIGRADSNDLVLDHPSVSRHHARLTVLPGDTTLLIDLGSLNGTHVNGQQIQEHPLADLERENKLLKLLLGVGKTLASVLTPDEVMRRVMELVFQMENVERGFVMLRDDEKKAFKPAVLLYKDERLKSQARP